MTEGGVHIIPWGPRRFAVEVRPRRVDRPTAPFASLVAALDHADQLASRYGLPVVDETQGGAHG